MILTYKGYLKSYDSKLVFGEEEHVMNFHSRLSPPPLPPPLLASALQQLPGCHLLLPVWCYLYLLLTLVTK